MSNVLFCSLDAPLIADIAWRVEREGHDVRYFISDHHPAEREIGDGFVTKSEDWRADLEWADVVVFDDIWDGSDLGTGKIAEELRADGHAVVGGTELTDRLEDDRGFAMETLEACGVATLPHREFERFEAGIEFVRENPAPYVVKPLGEVQNVKRLLYVGREDDGSDVVSVLEAYEKAWGHRMKGFQLQRRVEGVEVAICGFCNGDGFVEPINVNFEHKKLFPSNIGPSTGEMGTSMFWTDRCPLFEQTLGKLEPLLAEEGYVGSMDVNCIVDADGVYPLEFTPRFGYPAIYIQEEGMETPIGEFFVAIANGRDPDLQVHSGYQVGVRVCMPPFPYDDEKLFDETTRNAPVALDDDSVRETYHIEDVKRVPVGESDATDDTEDVTGAVYPDGQWRVAGTSGIVLVATGTGETMREAQERAYDRARNVLMPNCFYRTDIGDRWHTDASDRPGGDGDRLQAWGYL
ncbi:phosphoribosylglycinamide synthetase C domain-containing protein [Haloarcula pellucida]|uniref:phosphoribosylamine--glycine ligase n=1 Tax=Haloarcula pellucida TaxID=1427151 RepID=A0A830GKG6_9EURY|nr:phosphoribosylglycinamide synthetase C domain-containing protein [Halomicroarcula pellucida]MBX0348383.1 phosphoribosylamine--glycine ligase [Halomicroarcula pellucida]GGN93621.1 phosphoribosylamine--glycine ligase [Halomicroarcula pellucida]